MSDRDREDLHELVADYLDRLNSGDSLDYFAILSDHPEIGPDIIEKLEAFVELGSSPIGDNAPLGTLGDYTLRRQIGRGGMGVVYEAWENSMDRSVALKVLPPGVAADDRSFQRFMQEAKTAGKLSHPNVVPVYFTGVKEQTPFYAMEYVDGETLAQILAKIKDAEPETETPFGKKDRPAYFENLAECFADVADGLQHAHSKGVTHRDIKPSNLILDSEGRLRILDFGLARLEGQESLTLSGDFVGTPLYMSPEQARRKKIPVDHRTDVYSLGATMYEALCGRPPFKGRDHADTLSQIVERDPSEPRRLNARVPAELETIVLKCLRKQAGDRYGTAEALGQDLRRFVRGDPVEARPERPAERLIRAATRNRGRITVAGTIVVLSAISGILAYRVSIARRVTRGRQYEQRVVAAAMEISCARWIMRTTTLRGTDGERILSPRAIAVDDWGSLEDAVSDTARVMVERAALDLSGASEILPHRAEAHFYRARALRLLGREKEALASARQALRENPGFPPADAVLGKVEQKSGSDESAVGSEDLQGWGILWLRAEQARGERRYRDAVTALSELINLSESDGEPFVGCHFQSLIERGEILLELHEFATAARDFWAARTLFRARAKSPLGPVLYLGRTYCLDGRPGEAEKLFLREFQGSQDPGNVALWVALSYESAGESKMAVHWLERAGNNPLAQQLRTRLADSLNDTSASLEAARAEAESRPNDVRTHLALVVALARNVWSVPEERQQNIEELVEVAKAVEELVPDSAECYAIWSEIWRLRGDTKRAREFEGRARGAREALYPEHDTPHLEDRNDTELGGQFIATEIVSDPGVNSPWVEWAPELSTDGRTLYFTSYRPSEGGGNADLWVVHRSAGGIWRGATPLAELNTSAWEAAPSISSDGQELYFVSTRRGQHEIWISRRDPLTGRFRSPRPLEEVAIEGCTVRAPEISFDGLELFFHVFGVKAKEGLWVAWRDDTSQSFEYENMRPLREVNSDCNEMQPSVSRDGKTLFWSNQLNGPCGPSPRIWVATRPAIRDANNKPMAFERPHPLPISGRAPTISGSWPDAGAELYFISCIRGQCTSNAFDISRATWSLTDLSPAPR